MSTPGMTGNLGKWSARYSSPRLRNLAARRALPGSTASIRSIRWNRIGQQSGPRLVAGRPAEPRRIIYKEKKVYSRGGRGTTPDPLVRPAVGPASDRPAGSSAGG